MLTLLKQVQAAERKHGAEAVADCIRNSIASNYQGPTLDKLDRMQTSSPKTNQQKNFSMLEEWMKEAKDEEE